MKVYPQPRNVYKKASWVFLFKLYYSVRKDMDYSQEGRNMVADLMSKWGASWDEGVNKMDLVYKSETGGHIYVGGWEVRISQTKSEEELISVLIIRQQKTSLCSRMPV